MTGVISLRFSLDFFFATPLVLALTRHLSIYSCLSRSVCWPPTSLCRGCEKNEASYNVFQLDAFVNTTAISNLKQFPKVTQAIDAIDVSERTLLSLTQTIQNILESMLQTSSFNLTTYRATIGAPTPEKDLATFIDQMQRVALQVSFCGIVNEIQSNFLPTGIRVYEGGCERTSVF